MPSNNQPPREVQQAYARKCQRLSEEIEKITRLAVYWMDRGTVRELWQAQSILYHLARRLKES